MISMISDNGEVSIRAVTATGLVKGACQMQATSAVASAALGRTMLCALMLAAGKKTAEMYGETGQESVQIDIRGDGPLKQSFAVADGRGEVRGYVAQPFVALPPNSMGKLDVAAAVGKGIITVVRNNPMWRQPYSGITQIVSGEIAVDMAHYLTDSEQTPSALGAGVLVDTNNEEVIASGGWLVQMLPGATDETITQVEKNVMSLDGSPTDLIRAGKSALDICNMLSAGLRDGEIYPPITTRPRFTCKCSMEKVHAPRASHLSTSSSSDLPAPPPLPYLPCLLLRPPASPLLSRRFSLATPLFSRPVHDGRNIGKYWGMSSPSMDPHPPIFP